jgi:hypothetical protein
MAGVLYGADHDWPFGAGIAGIAAVIALGLILLRGPAGRNRGALRAYTSVERVGD